VNWWARYGLRARLMLMVVLVVALGLALIGGGLYVALVATDTRRIDADARASATTVATLVETDQLPAVLPVSGAQLIQVVDAQGRVIAASPGADRLVAMLTPAELRQVEQQGPVSRPGRSVGIASEVRITALTAGRTGASVIVAVPIADVVATHAALRTALLTGLPLLLVVLAAAAWWVIGRTLHSVEALRAGAERIRTSGGEQDRLPLPPSTDEIHALAETLNAMLDRLAVERRRQRMFVADAAHELRTPLTTLRTEIEVAGLVGSVPPEVVSNLLVELERLTKLVEDLLLLARSEGDPGGRRAEEVLLADLLADVAVVYAARSVRVEADPVVPPDLAVRADPAELRRVLTNLVDNGVRHARSEVRLAARSEDAEAVLTVTDDGSGIPVADRERVFERFTRLDDSRERDAGGSGLGLAIVRDLVTRAGGRVSFGTDPELSQAEVRLPAVVASPHSAGGR
jgi:signal transduction histidine kinase